MKRGFTLIEIALAILVVAIGVLAVFALLSSGLDASQRAISDTHAAVFADNVFNGLAATAMTKAEEQDQLKGMIGGMVNTNTPWELFWRDFANGYTNVTVAVPDAWPEELIIEKGGPYKIVYTNRSFRGLAPAAGIVNVALQYSLDVTGKYDLNKDVLFTNRVHVTLKVWDGEYGTTHDEDALIFYSEFANPGDL